jgi:hypothetical protein
MEIKIMGHDSAIGFLKANYREYDVILYTNSDYDPPPAIVNSAKNIIHFPVDDVDMPSNQPHNRKVAPTVDVVKTALEWARDRERVLCVCHAGVSRSSSTAYLLACQKWGPEAALSLLRPLKHYPNRLIVKLGSLILENPVVWDRFVEWQIKGSGVDPTDRGTYAPVIDKVS